MSSCMNRCRAVVLGTLLVLASVAPLAAQNGAPGASAPRDASHGHAVASPVARAVALPGPVTLDGRLDDAAWAAAEPATDFRQQNPDDGQPATQRTEVRFLFDAEALYIGARMYDTEGGAGIRSRLVRRDQQVEADRLEVVFDTYHNHLGRTSFAVNPSGVRYDAGQASEYTDPSWDPVWEAKTAVDDEGWTAEIRIPFSQLRFPRDSVQVWGMQIWRTASRLNEVSMWSHWGRSEFGGPQRFGHLEGLAVQRGTRRLEVLPYVVGRSQFLRPGDAANPFFDQRTTDARAGVDLKYLLTSNLTLDATINPDFGQVEVDPAVVNLSAFETFFPERRPFFIEGSGVFGFGGFNCYFCSNVSSMSLFYSRRIGRSPQGAAPSGTDYADVPDASTILGAAKVSGRTGGGWTLGMLDAVTSREHARTMTGGVPGTHEVEPLTNYFVGRVRKDLNGGNLVVGAIATSVSRFTDEASLTSRLPSHAEALGLDWNARWKNRTYSFMGNMAFTSVSGEATAIDRLQRSSARYFQRPDRAPGSNGAFSSGYDPTATSLRGWGGYGRVAKEAGNWLWEVAGNVRSQGFEANDMAFLTRADYYWMNANLFRTFNRPTSWYRQINLIAGAQQQYNFEGDLTDRQFHGFLFYQFLNYWNVNGFVIRRTEVDDDRLTRGGPVVRRVGNWFYNANLNTDSRKSLSFFLNGNYSRTDEGYVGYGTSLNAQIRPASNLSVSVAPSYNLSRSAQQYVTAVDAPGLDAFYGRRYVFADLEQRTIGFDTRVNLTMSPGLTVELYAQPFISSVHHDRFKEFAAPRTTDKRVYGEDIGTIAAVQSAGGQVTGYSIDPDGAGAQAAFTIQNPDFNLRSLRGNMVIRWEYRPGSTLFLVWTRAGSDFSPFVDDFRAGRDVDAMFAAKADNVFLLKMTYWLNR